MPIGEDARGPVAGREWELPRGGGGNGALPLGERVLSRYRVRGQALFDASGVATLNLGAPPLGTWWLVDRIIVETDAGTDTEARVFTGEVTPTNVDDVTPGGNQDVSEYPRGLYVAGGADLLVQWTGGSLNDVAFAAAQVAEMGQG